MRIRSELALAAVIITLGAFSGAVSAQGATYPPNFSEQTVFSGLTNPTAVRFSSDGRVFIAEKSGLIKVFDSLSDPSPTIFADLRTKVHNFWDRGMLGFELDPNFPATPYVYVLYAHDAVIGGTAPRWGSPGATFDGCPDPPGATGDGCVVSGRLSRLEAVGAGAGPEQVLIEDWCQQYPSHSVGSLAFGADGALYVTGGDGASFNFVDYGQDGNPLNPCGDPPGGVGGAMTPPSAQGGALRSQDLRTSGDPTSLDGTVLRLNPATGAAMPGNPLIGSSDVNARRIIAQGLRNPFRMTVRPGTSEVWLGDVGWGTWEEINRVENPTAGVVNFGWPCYEGSAPQGGYDGANLLVCENLYAAGAGAVRSPFYAWNHSARVVTGETCPTGSSSAAGTAFAPASGGPYPSAYSGALFFADYSRDCIWAMLRSGGPLPDPGNRLTFAAGAANPVDLRIGPGGELYYADFDGGTIRRVSYTSSNRPPVAVADASPRNGPAPLTVNFDGTGSSDPDDDPITYAWDLDGDGQHDDSTSPTPSFTYAQVGVYTASLRVTDDENHSSTASVTIDAGNTPPQATITAPAAGTNWKVGDRIDFAGGASDGQDGALPPAALSWSVVLHHCPSNCHPHPVQSWDGTAGDYFPAPDHEYPSYLELRLTARDSGGLTDVESLRLDPRTVDLTVGSTPPGLELTLNSESGTAPLIRQVIEGSTNSVGAPSPQAADGKNWVFSSWSDGGAAQHNLKADQDTSVTATYSESTSRQALLVVKNAGALGAADAALRSRLEGLGFQVTVASETAGAGDASGKDVVLISSSVGSSALQTRFRDVAVPVIVWEGGLYDDMGMTAATGTFYGESPGITSLTISDPAHPLAAGLTGTRVVSSAATTLKWGRPGGSAATVATVPGDATRAAIFAYESGSTMPGLTAPAKRIGLFLHDQTPSTLTADGWRLFEAAVLWATNGGPPPPPPPPPPPAGEALLVAGSPILGGGDAAVRQRLIAAGYTVQVVDDGLSTVGDATGKELVLISSSVSSSALQTRFRDVAVPVIVWEGGLYDDMGMTAATGAFYGEPTGSALAITEPAHPLAAGLSGTQSVTTAPTTLKWGAAGPSAIKAATMPGDATRAAIFGYASGAAMPGVNAPARRVGLFLHDQTASTLSSAGGQLFDASVSWSTGT
jgi:glucose/arabinose dehydrogenase/PKD repeat protein